MQTAEDQKLLDTKGFVLEARDYSTLSVTVIITVPCVLVFLSLVLIALEVNMRLTVIKEYKPIKDTYASRLRFLNATQLYRFLNDSTYKKVDQDLKWLPVLDKLELRTPHCDEGNVCRLLPLADLETDTGVSK
ncbi:hypothetical protein FPQ18DRAFT_303191 [Pyronema domesticum]|nr:hypothetical protein FPQ18DRAFT_303191 [Pyronema domesticum]